MLQNLPKYPPEFRELVADLGNPSVAKLAKALDVSERTIQRWLKTDAPRTTLLALWWLSRHGHMAWDAEMHNRTEMAISTNRILWMEIARLRTAINRGITKMDCNAINGAAANDQVFLTDQYETIQEERDRGLTRGSPLSLRSVGRGVAPQVQPKPEATMTGLEGVSSPVRSSKAT